MVAIKGENMTRDESYYGNVRQAATELWFALHKLRDAQTQWNALNYLDTLPNGEGVNSGITKNELGPVVFDTTNALFTVFLDGHKTNLAKILY